MRMLQRLGWKARAALRVGVVANNSCRISGFLPGRQKNAADGYGWRDEAHGED